MLYWFRYFASQECRQKGTAVPDSKKQINIPTKEGLTEARRKLKDMRRKEPSPDLLKIIDEVTQDKELEKDSDIAARPRQHEAGV